MVTASSSAAPQHLPVIGVAPLRRHRQHLPELPQVVRRRIGQRRHPHQLRNRPVPRRVALPHNAAAADQTQSNRSLHSSYPLPLMA